MLITCIISLFTTLCLLGCQSGPQMKVVISNDGETVGRYVSEDSENYTVCTQDDFHLKKSKARVEVWRASDGKGIITLSDFGTKPVFSTNNENSDVIGEMLYEEGYCPDVYPCLGYQNGWFQTEINGVSGFIPEKYVQWDAINTY